MVSGLGAGRAGLDAQRRSGEHPLDGAFFAVFNFFELTWGFILYDFWSPTEAERFKKHWAVEFLLLLLSS